MAIIGEIRNRAGWLVLGFVGIALVAFLLMDVSSSTGGGAPGQSLSIGKINGKDISYQEYQRKVDNAMDGYRRQGQIVNDDLSQSIREQTWNTYLAELVANDEYEKLGLTVSNEELTQLMRGSDAHPTVKSSQIFVNQQTQQFDPNLVVAYVESLDEDNQYGTSEEKRIQWNSFTNFVKRDALDKKYKNLVKKGSFIPNFLATNDFKNNNSKVTFNYLVLPYASVLDGDVAVTDAELQSYLDENRDNFDDEATRNLDFVEFYLTPSQSDSTEARDFIATRIEDFSTAENDTNYLNIHSETPLNTSYIAENVLTGVQASEILAQPVGGIVGPYFEGNSYKAAKLIGRQSVPDSVDVRHILIDPNKKGGAERAIFLADSLFNELKNGGDFDFIAADFSDDASNKENGGNLGYAKPGQMVKPFNDLIFYKANIGELNKVNSQFGIHLVEVLDKKGATPSIAVGYLTKTIEPGSTTQKNIYRTANEFAGKNRDAASFDAAVKDQDFISKPAFGLKINDSNLPGLGYARDIIKWVFNAENGEVSEVFSMDDKYVVAKVSNIKEEGELTVEGLKSELQAAVRKQKRVAQLSSQLSATNGNNLQKRAENFDNVSVQTATDVSLQAANIQGAGLEPAVVGRAMALQANSVSEPIEGNNGVYLVKVTDKVAASDSISLDLTRQSMNVTNGSRIDGSLLNALKESVEVKDQRYKFY